MPMRVAPAETAVGHAPVSTLQKPAWHKGSLGFTSGMAATPAPLPPLAL